MNGPRQTRQQAGCVPLRRARGTLEVLLVTSRTTGEWIVPKGTVEPGETAEMAAVREAEEEAGVRGQLARSLGVFTVPWGTAEARLQTFVLDVHEELDGWPERSSRERRWFSLADAFLAVRRPEIRAMLAALCVTP